MPRTHSGLPTYRRHRPSGQAVVSFGRTDIYLGPWKSKRSLAEYDRLIAEYIANGRRPPDGSGDAALTITELIAAHWRFAKGYYVKNGKPTRSLGNLRDAVRPLKRLYGRTLAAEFGPLALKAIKQHMIDSDLARVTINKRLGDIKRCFKWGASEELVPTSVYQALLTVEGVKKYRSEARDNGPVETVPEVDFQATLPHLPGIVADMALVQRLTGCRPGEVCILRPCDIERSSDVWTYRPESHKAEHHGRERIIFIGPKTQQILRPYLLRAADAYCFDPRETVRKLHAERHKKRNTPLGYGNSPGTNRRRRPKRQAGSCYTPNSYRCAIHRACDKAGVPRWSPNQLRHSAATEIRGKYGLEAAQVILGHARADVTQLYAARDMALGVRVAAESG